MRVRKHEFEILEGLSVTEYLLGDPTMCGDGSNISTGGRALIPLKGSLNESVELRELESSSLDLFRVKTQGSSYDTLYPPITPNVPVYYESITFQLPVRWPGQDCFVPKIHKGDI